MLLRSAAFILVFSLVLPTLSFGQSRQGNIVEYFGKEKVNEISEGELIHVFKKGLAVTINTGFGSDIDFPKEVVFDRFLNEEDYVPKAGLVFDIDESGEPIQWENIEVDTTNTFNDRSLRSSYVYLSYESDEENIVLFEASGHTIALINGFPHEGDHYDFGWSLVPLKLKKGMNTFVLKVGRFPRIRARIIQPSADLVFTSRDLTTPDVLKEENRSYYGAIRIVNASEDFIRNAIIEVEHGSSNEQTRVSTLPPLSVTKLPFRTPDLNIIDEENIDLKLDFLTEDGKSKASTFVTLNTRSAGDHHKRTFISDIDQSVQYYSVAPSTTDSTNQALFLSVHGASVEATNQARAYKKKDWGTLVAPTNRRPFGFAWEDWGRIDAMEVLADAKKLFQPDPQRVYLTGHSMGGHGTWYLGATYPDHFAAIAPCAGYPDLLEYRNSFRRRLQNMSTDQLKRFGMTQEMVAELSEPPSISDMESMVKRGGNPSRTLTLKRNYLHHGVYILHGEDDNVVPTFIARDMRENLGSFHNDFTYYEYPEGTHWYGDHSVDWPPIFDFFRAKTIPVDREVKNLEFYTASPGVSATSHFVTILQQERPLEVSSFQFNREEGFELKFENTTLAEIDFSRFDAIPDTVNIDHNKIATDQKAKLYVRRIEGEWRKSVQPPLREKGPHRNGGFKDAFTNHFVIVYGTTGSQEVNEWNRMKAMFDAETFSYRANGKVEVIKDIDFSKVDYKDRNVILYGNSDSNAAWSDVLKDCPIVVSSNSISINKTILPGDHWGTYFIYPRSDSDVASVGVVAASGLAGLKATFPNDYLVNGTSFPDLILFDDSALKTGTSAIKCVGFFGNDWTVEKGTWEWR